MPDVEPGSDVPVAQEVFVAEFRRCRDLSGLSRAALAKVMGYSRSYVSKVESGTEHASREFVKTADHALNTGGALHRAWRARSRPYDYRHENRPEGRNSGRGSSQRLAGRA